MKAIEQNGNQVFSFERYWALLETYLTENGKTIGIYTAAFFGFTILVELFIGTKFEDEVEAPALLIYMFMMGIMALGPAISASLMFSSMQGKAGRINTLMLPASHTEKFLVRTTVYLVLFAISTIIVMALGEGVRYLCSPMNYRSVYQLLMDVNMHISFSWHFIIVSVLSSHAVYTLGSVLWPRKSFVKTLAVTAALSVVFSILIPWSLIRDYSDYLLDIDVSEVQVFIYAITYAYAAAAYVAAFILFRKSQVVQRFM